MPMPHPPLIDTGVILTIGIVSDTDRVAIVFPLITDDPGLSFNALCQDAVLAVQDHVLTDLLNVLADNSHVAYIQAEGMIDGCIPDRIDFAAAAHPGAGGSDAMPNNVSGLTIFYGDPLDIVDGDRMVAGKTFWPAVPKDEVVGDIISDDLHGNYVTLAAILRAGFNTHLTGGKWYRVASKGNSREPGTTGIACTVTVTRNYVATQRRRMTPH